MSAGAHAFPPEADLAGWIIGEALTGAGLSDLFGGLCERFVVAGIPICRAYIALPMVSPDMRAVNYTWRPGAGTIRQGVRHDSDASEFQTSPFWHMLHSGETFRRWEFREEPVATGFPVLEELRAQGATDHVAYIVSFDSTGSTALQGAAMSFTCESEGGFTEWDLARLGRFVQLLGLAACRFAMSDLVTDILGAYVGHDAGRRVLRGEMRRGQGHRLRAALLFADLQGFTTVAETSGEAIVTRLGEHLAAMAEPVEAFGGQVLKFLGDGLLASFGVEDDETGPACARALRAAREALRRNAAVNEAHPGATPLDLHVALHLGEVFYGNIGAASRLDFTVIGPAVNEASRIETLCGVVGPPLLMSAAFASCCGHPTVSLGTHQLRGIAEPRELHALVEPA
jgi:adenylate cyclase